METPEIIHVLIVDNNPETREKLRSLLKSEQDMEVVGTARTGKEAIELATDTEPDVVVVDVNLPDIDEIAVTEAICRRVPFSQIVILAVQVDPNYMRRAMLAGARDFIVKPPLADELRSAVYRAGGLAHEKRASSMRGFPQGGQESTQAPAKASALRGKIIQVYSPKGGVGTTAIATNLAVALQSAQTKTVLVDGNLQFGDVAVNLNEMGYHNILDLTHRIDDMDADLIESVMVTHKRSGVDIMVAPNRPEMADEVSGEEFYKVLQHLRRYYTYIVVDTPPAMNDITLSVMDGADVIVLLTTQDIAAIKNIRLFLNVTDGLHISRQRIIFTMNRYDKRIAISPEKVSDNLKQEIVSVIPLDEETVVRAANQGVPFVLQNNTQPVAKSVIELADILKNRLVSLESADISQLKVFRANN